MLLCVDIGNSNINFGLFNGSCDDMVCCFSISSAVKRTSDEYFLIINQMLSQFSVEPLPDSFCISSVVPTLTADVCAACQRLCGCEPFIISKGTKTGFPIKIDSQAQLGADIVSNTAAAFKFAKPPFAVVDVGTATTVTAVDRDGQLIGAVIAPGANISLEALKDSAALLTDVSLQQPDAVIGKNSQDSIRSGIFYGHVYMIDGFIRQIRSELCEDGEKLALIGTGGLSKVILPHCRNKFEVIENLTLKGAASLFYQNTANRHRNYTKSI